MSDTIRTFISIKLPESTISSINRIQDGLLSYGFKVRWVRSQNIHLTLKFLGDIRETDVDRIGDAMTESAGEYGPITLNTKGIGTFPGIKRPRIVWVGITGQVDRLAGLQGTLEKRLAKLGFPEENRSFKGHLTIGRIKGRIDPKRFLDAMHEFAEFGSTTFTADKIILFRSELKPSGAVYTELLSASL